MKTNHLIVPAALALLSACTPKLERPEVDKGSVNTSGVYAVGDSYLCGYQNGALLPKGQENSVASQVVVSFGAAGAVSWNQPLVPPGEGIGRNAKPWESAYVSASRLGDRTDCNGVVSLGPVKRSYSVSEANYYLASLSTMVYHDLSVPFISMGEMVYPAFSPSNEFLDRFCPDPSTGIPGLLSANSPSFSIVWTGMEDIFRYARNGGYGQTFQPLVWVNGVYDELFQYLTANGGKGVIANIPDFRTMPFYTLIPWNGANLDQEKADSLTSLYASSGLGHISFTEGDNPFVIEDAAAPGGYRQMVQGEYITLTVPLDSMKCYFYGLLINPIHDRYVLDTAEVAQLDVARMMYNTVIAQKAQQYGFALVDADALFSRLSSGIWFNGVKYTSEFVSGGFFSLDGFHPTQKAANIIANEFILSINKKFSASFPIVHCESCDGLLFP